MVLTPEGDDLLMFKFYYIWKVGIVPMFAAKKADPKGAPRAGGRLNGWMIPSNMVHLRHHNTYN